MIADRRGSEGGMDERPIGGLVDRFDLDGADIEIDSESLWTTLGRGGFSRSGAAGTRVDELLPVGASLLRPRAMGRLYRVDSSEEPQWQTLPEPIREAEVLCFGLCTAGEAIDEQARALCENGDLIDSMILDAIAMTGLSLIGDRLGRAIFVWAESRGLSASRAFAPGAGASRWTLEGQRFLFRHLPERPLGVQLTDRFLMRPSKSVSFVIGIGECVTQAANPFSCEGCARFDCAYRHIPEGEMVHPGTERASSSHEERT